MGSYTLTGSVQSGQTGAPLYFTAVRVALYDASTGTPTFIGESETGFAGAFSIEVPDPDAQGIYYAAATWGDDDRVMLATIIGPTIRGPIVLNELTTVSAAYAMAQFANGSEIGGGAFGLRIAAGMCDNLVSPLTGQPSEVMQNGPNGGQTNSLASIRSLGNLLSPIIRNFPDVWEELRELATPPVGSPPANTFEALVNIAHHPAQNVDEIYQQTKVLEIYTPPLSAKPDAAWTLAVKVNHTGDDGKRMFGGPANISWDANGYAWVANNVFQGTPNSCDFVVVLKPNGMPSDGTNGTPRSPVVGAGIVGPGFGVSVGPDGHAWVGSFGWGPSDTFPTEGIVSKFRGDGTPAPETPFMDGVVRVQGTVVDANRNVWLASYGTNAVVVYPEGDPKRWFSYPADGSGDPAPGSYTFGIAMDPTEEGAAWATWSGGLGWPTAYPGAVARLKIDGGALTCTFQQPLGAAVKGNAVDRFGNAWVASGGDDTVYLVTKDGHTFGFKDRAGLLGPWGVAVDGNNDVWVANFGRMGITEDYTNAGVSKLAGVDSPSRLAVGEALTPSTGYTLPSGGDPVLLADGSPVYKDGTECISPLMRMTSVTIDAAGNLWAVNNWKPRFRTDFEPENGNPGGDGIVIFVGLAKPPVTPG